MFRGRWWREGLWGKAQGGVWFQPRPPPGHLLETPAPTQPPRAHLPLFSVAIPGILLVLYTIINFLIFVCLAVTSLSCGI